MEQKIIEEAFNTIYNKRGGYYSIEKQIKINGKENEALNKQFEKMKKGEKIW